MFSDMDDWPPAVPIKGWAFVASDPIMLRDSDLVSRGDLITEECRSRREREIMAFHDALGHAFASAWKRMHARPVWGAH